MKYIVNIINGETVYTSARTGRTLTGAARKACERAEAEREAREQEAINEAVENALILDWYKENAIEIDAEQERVIAQCRNQRTHGEGFTLASTATVTIWPSAFGQGFTRAQAHIWLKEIRAKRYAERRANMKRTYNTAHKTQNNKARAISYVARKILGAKAIHEGKHVKFVFTRKIYTLRSLAWQNLPPRVGGKIGVAKTDNGLYAWAFVGVINGLPLWVITKVYEGLNFPVVLDITKKGGDDNPSKGEEDTDYEAFCDKLDEIIHAKPKGTPKRIAITGWAFTTTMLRNIESAYEDEDVKEEMTHTFKMLTAQFVRNALACMGWKYNAERIMQKNAVIDFLNRRDTEKFPIFTSARYDLGSTIMAIQAVNRCMLYAMKKSENAVVADKETRPILARLCRKLITWMKPVIDD